MRVYIGPYTRWIGPYQISSWIPFISEETADKIGDWLADTWVNDLCNWIESKKQRTVKIHIDKWDTWNMDHTLALIILPMLKQLKATKHGSPNVDDEDLPPEMRYKDKEGYDEQTGEWHDYGGNWVHYRWEWILNELIWTFEQLLDDDWESQYTIVEGELDLEEYPEDEGKDVTPLRWKKEYVIDRVGRDNHQKRITNGLRLFGKYYQNLWD